MRHRAATTMAIQDEAAQTVDAPAGARRYARFSRRLLAAVVDSAVYALAAVLVILVADLLPGQAVKGAVLGWLAFALLYEPVLVSRRGATVGHALANVRVVELRSGCAPGFLRALARLWLKSLVGVVGFAFMGTTRHHQALHDLPVGTTVEIRDPGRAHPAQYGGERRPEPGVVLPPPWRRVAMIVSYSLATIVLITVILLVVESGECLEGRRCSTADRLLEAVLEVLALGALAAWIVLGWWGRLPGARACSVEVPGVLANAGGRMVEPVERACESSSADAGPPVPPVGAGQRGRGALRLVKTGALWLGGLALLAAVGAQTLGVVWLAQRLEDLPSLQSAATIAVDELVESGAFTPGRPYDPVADGRRVVFTSAINPTTVKPVVERLLLLDSRDPKTPIDLFLWSHGGWGGAAFAVIDAMYSIRAPVNVQAIGHCFSACALILVSATGTRTVAPHALLMVHANLDEPEGEAADLFRYLPAYNERFERLWREHAALPDDWFPMTRGETYYLTPQQALELKVVDRIVGGRGR